MIKTLKYFVALCLSALAVQASSDDPNVGRPHEHFCPITLGVMHDPVVAGDGYSYERAAITEYLSRKLRSPRTNATLKNATLIPNVHLKTLIAEWKPGRQAIPSHFDTQDSRGIARLIRAEFSKHTDLLHASRGRDIVVFLGNTGAGKSTLVDLLAGKKLISYGEDYVLEDPTDPTAMAIGTSGDSETVYPKPIVMGEYLFFDLPGFNDSDGSERNLVNAAFIRSILMEAASVRAVFVAGQDEFTAQRGQSVKELFDGIKRLIVAESPEEDLVTQGLFVVTKSTCHGDGPAIDFLLKKTTSTTRPLLQEQLQAWALTNQLTHMKHPRISNDSVQESTRENLLRLIAGLRPVRVSGMNVSVLYPLEIRGALFRMFGAVMEECFTRRLETPTETLSYMDILLRDYQSTTFWDSFGESVCNYDHSVDLLKGFCIDKYNEALSSFKIEWEPRRKAYVSALELKRAERVALLERKADPYIKIIFEAIAKNIRDLSSIYGDLRDPKELEAIQHYFANYVDIVSTRLEDKEKALATLRPLTSGPDALVRPAPAGAGAGGTSGAASGISVPQRPLIPTEGGMNRLTLRQIQEELDVLVRRVIEP